MKNRHFHSDRKSQSFLNLGLVVPVVVTLIVVVPLLVFVAAFITQSSPFTTSLLCSSIGSSSSSSSSSSREPHYPTRTQLQAILHYATSRVVPQQTRAEISLSFNVLSRLSPCNFLVFGLGHDSLMWAALNPRSTTVFLEEDPTWIQSIVSKSPTLRAIHVKYATQLWQAGDLIASYKQHEDCLLPNVRLKNDSQCDLVLKGLPDEVYDKEWDVIMIDAPRGYFREAPGRMGAIFTAAVMAWWRVKGGVTHVFLHDVNRKVEKMYAEEFLCEKYRVEGVGRLWHFEIPPYTGSSSSFC